MAKPLQWAAVCAALSVVASATAQASSNSRAQTVVTKTLLASEAQKECFSLTNHQRLHYRFRSDGPLDFKLSHEDDREVIDVRSNRTDSAEGTFTPKKTVDHCLVWTNTGNRAVTLHYEFRRGPR